MDAVRASDVFHLYRAAHGDVAALRGLSLTVAEGEVVSVLGPSGSGKTTLLELCAGFRRASSGELNVLGLSLTHVRPREAARLRRDAIGIVRQHYHRSLPRELTVRETVELPLRLAGRLGRSERGHVDALLRTAGLERHAGAHPEELSGGEQQRVAVCAAVAKRPRLILADEPTGELDPQATGVVAGLLRELAGEVGAAALVVTHDPHVALAADRTIHIRDGRLAAEGAASPVLIIDEQGWVRLPQRLRDEAGFGLRVHARASWGRVELYADDPRRRPVRELDARPSAAEKRTETEVALDRVTRRYVAHDDPVLDGFSWTFAPERLHVLVGPSGSGKTTILNLIAGLDRPDDGEVWLAGERIDSLGPDAAALLRQRLVGYVSQHSTLVEYLSARENVELALSLRRFGEAETSRRAERWLGLVGLEHLADRRADRLSGGEQRRVALARALAPGPRILLADEPTAHLDRLAGRQVIRLLQDAVRAGTTVVAGSHDPDLVAAADTRVRLDVT